MKALLSFSRTLIVLTALLIYWSFGIPSLFWIVVWLILLLMNLIFDAQYFNKYKDKTLYLAGYLYFFKSLVQILLVVFGFLILDLGVVFFMTIIPPWIVYAVNIILVITLLMFSFMIATSKPPSLKFEDNGFVYRRKTIRFEEVKSILHQSGGSEPELEFYEGSNLVLELSWFSKKDRNEILSTIQKNING